MPRSRVHYDESKVPHYTLPDPLTMENGEKVHDATTWSKTRRPEIIQLFETYVYGLTPEKRHPISYDVFDQSEVIVDDGQGGQPIRAIRRQIRASFSEKDDRSDEDGPSTGMDIILYTPITHQPVPVFVGLNFRGNHTIIADPNIRITKSWVRNREGTKDNRSTEEGRGIAATRWPLHHILHSGYAVATAYYGDIDPDFHDGFQNGVHPYFYAKSQNKPAPDEWATIGAWAWGLSRILDYLGSVNEVDDKKAVVFGHSRLGKTALWAAAQDERFAIAISNNSGCGGAAISRRRFGETLAVINNSFPHWFCDNFKQFNDREDQLPVDQHMLIAAIAPRPVYVASATEDLWADPQGEFSSLLAANSVYRLFGIDGISEMAMPQPNISVGNKLGYHIRQGKHDITISDWIHYIKFADKHL